MLVYLLYIVDIVLGKVRCLEEPQLLDVVLRRNSAASN